MLFMVRVKVKPGRGKELPVNWKYAAADTYAFFTKEGHYWYSNLQRKEFVLEVALHTLATGEISVYSSTHAERKCSAVHPTTNPEKISWLKLLFSTKKPKT